MTWNTHIPKFRRFVLQNFPFIEEDFDALTDYQLICKVIEFLNNVITSQNEVVTEVERFETDVNNEIDTFETNITNNFNRLEGLFNDLKSFVDNYFDNLDVQEEINNKLDQMVEDGTLQEIITAYIQSNVTWTFDTVADMKQATNLVDGSYAQTLGFHSINDGGGAIYKITNSGTANEMDVIAISNDLNAHLVVLANKLNVLQLGSLPDGNTDCTSVLQKAVDTPYKVYIPSGQYKITDSIIVDSYTDIELEGEGGFTGTNSDKVATIISTSNKPAVRIIGECVKITGGQIKALETTTNGLVMVDMSDELTRTTTQMNNITIDSSIYKSKYDAGGVGDNSVGVCIYFGSSSSSNSGTNLQIKGSIRDFDYGIKADKSSLTTNAWLSSIRHSGIIVNCCYAVYLNKSSSGSTFSGVYQCLTDGTLPNGPKYSGCLYFKDVQSILIDGFVWDFGLTQNGNQYAVDFDGLCDEVNYVHGIEGSIKFGSNTYIKDIYNHFTNENNYPFGGLSSNNEQDLLAFGNLKYAVKYITPNTISAESNPNFWRNALDRSLIANYSLFKPVSSTPNPEEIEYGYEIYFDRNRKISQFGFQADYRYTPLSMSVYVYHNHEWKLDRTIKCKYDVNDPETVHGYPSRGIGVVYYDRLINSSDVWKNTSTPIDGVKFVFKGFSNNTSGTHLTAIWAKEEIPSSISGEKLAINGGKTYGQYLFSSNPVIIDSTTGDCYKLGVSNGTFSASKITANDPKKFVLSKNSITMSVSSSETITVRLRDIPIGDSPISFSSNNPEVSVTSSVAFNAGNWNTEETVTITTSASATGAATITATSLWGTDSQTIQVNVV